MTSENSLTIAIASGKGGTGKTLVATSLAAVEADAGRSVALVDCDVEAPNDHIFFRAQDTESSVVETRVAQVDPEKCTACGKCRDVCAYGAIRILGKTAIVFDEMCHGCGLCRAVCSVKAIKEPKKPVGSVEVSRVDRDATSLWLVTGRLDVGQVKTPNVIQAARKAGTGLPVDMTVLDAPPGVACAAVAAIRGADAIILVTEPTPFGLHDLDLSVRLAQDMGIPCAVIVNRSDAGGVDVGEWCDSKNIPVLMHIPFDREIAEKYAVGGLVSDEMPELAEQFGSLLAHITALIDDDAGIMDSASRTTTSKTVAEVTR